MFHRRRNRNFRQSLKEIIYPRGGWRRAAQYVWYRLRRLPDAPHRIARGVAAGIFISFTPFFGFHLIGAGILAWAFGGNIIAALLATLIGNPVTFPFIAVAAVTLGRNLLGMESAGGATRIVSEIGRATGDLGNNILSLVSERDAEWGHLTAFFHDVFVPYVTGGLLLGLLAGTIGHVLTVPLIRAYQRHRTERRTRRREQDALARQAAADAAPTGGAQPVGNANGKMTGAPATDRATGTMADPVASPPTDATGHSAAAATSRRRAGSRDGAIPETGAADDKKSR